MENIMENERRYKKMLHVELIYFSSSKANGNYSPAPHFMSETTCSLWEKKNTLPYLSDFLVHSISLFFCLPGETAPVS